MIKLT